MDPCRCCPWRLLPSSQRDPCRSEKPDHFADRLVEHVAIEDDAREVEIQRGPEFLQVIELAVLQDFLEQDPRAEVRGDRDQLARDLDLLRQAVDQKVQCLLPLP